MTVENLYRIFLEHPEVFTDSRTVLPGGIFFALKGQNFNGNEFAADTLKKGSAYAIVDEPKYCTDERCILVEDVLKTLQQLANHHRKKYTIPVIAITGTNGKTTTKELLTSVLSKKYQTLSTTGNLNNHIGVPLTLLKLKPETQIAVIEMGANHPGEIDFLCRIAEPTHGIITNIGKAHLEGFGGFEGVIRTKTELYRFLKSRKGLSFVNESNSILSEQSAGLKKITYGFGPACDVRGENVDADPFTRLDICFEQEQFTVVSRLFGKYNAENILAAACMGQYFRVELPEIKEALESYQPVNNRSQVIQAASNILILDMYNANPSSMELALKDFSGTNPANKVVILGDMLELGDESDKEHRLILDLLGNLDFKQVYLVGPVFTRLNTKREWLCFQDSQLAGMWLEHHKIKDSTIMIKGSRGIRLEKVVEALTDHPV